MRFFSALLLLGLASASALLAPVSRAVAPPRTAAPFMKEAVTRIEIEVEQGEPLEKARAPPRRRRAGGGAPAPGVIGRVERKTIFLFSTLARTGRSRVVGSTRRVA